MKLNIQPKVKVLPCPFCGSKKIKFDRMVSVLEWHNHCGNCGYKYPIYALKNEIYKDEQ